MLAVGTGEFPAVSSSNVCYIRLLELAEINIATAKIHKTYRHLSIDTSQQDSGSSPSHLSGGIVRGEWAMPHHEQVAAGYADDADIWEGLEDVLEGGGGEREHFLGRVDGDTLLHSLDVRRHKETQESVITVE